MDSLGKALGIDPFEIRMINALKAGSTTVTGQVLNASVGIKETLQKIKTVKENRENRLKIRDKKLSPWIKTGWGGLLLVWHWKYRII